MGCCIGARTSQAEAGDKEFQSGSRYPRLSQPDSDGFGLTYDMDGQHVFVLIPKPLRHTHQGRLRNNTPESVKI